MDLSPATKTPSTPSLRNRSARRSASSSPSTPKASVRPTMKVSGLRRSASATRSFASMIPRSTTPMALVGAVLLVLALLVLDEDRAYADLLVELDHPRDALDVAVTVAAVSEERQLCRGGDLANAGGHVGYTDGSDVGTPAAGGQ